MWSRQLASERADPASTPRVGRPRQHPAGRGSVQVSAVSTRANELADVAYLIRNKRATTSNFDHTWTWCGRGADVARRGDFKAKVPDGYSLPRWQASHDLAGRVATSPRSFTDASHRRGSHREKREARVADGLYHWAGRLCRLDPGHGRNSRGRTFNPRFPEPLAASRIAVPIDVYDGDAWLNPGHPGPASGTFGRDQAIGRQGARRDRMPATAPTGRFPIAPRFRLCGRPAAIPDARRGPSVTPAAIGSRHDPAPPPRRLGPHGQVAIKDSTRPIEAIESRIMVRGSARRRTLPVRVGRRRVASPGPRVADVT